MSGKSSDSISIFDICPDIGSYMADVEENLKMDSDTWNRYKNDPYPFVMDVVCDFGDMGVLATAEDPEAALRMAVRAYC